MRGSVIACGLSIIFSASVYAEDVKTEIISRCKSQMGQYGAAMVKACVDQDLEAVDKIGKIPEKYKATVSRCMKQMRKYGFSMVNACAEQDIEADQALSKY
ncbi:hypothetical protein ABFV54_13045 [Pseudomonas syringae]|uniref:hypothetical protein n=1 Tax=Pseudomonas syringae TaxID=317 RepID=UPI0034D56296